MVDGLGELTRLGIGEWIGREREAQFSCERQGFSTTQEFAGVIQKLVNVHIGIAAECHSEIDQGENNFLAVLVEAADFGEADRVVVVNAPDDVADQTGTAASVGQDFEEKRDGTLVGTYRVFCGEDCGR